MKGRLDKVKKYSLLIWKRIKNKWILAFLVLFVWLLFFEDVNLFALIKTQSKINQLEKDWEYTEQRIQEVKEKKELILNDVEKYARETYWMKKDNEEIFIFPKKDKNEDGDQ